MIGNDIIDLEASGTESNWQRKGWIQKIFSKQEQDFIYNTENKERTIWLFWSMKEAAYKIFNRSNHKMFYAPAAFHCTLNEMQDSFVLGQVIYKEYTYNTKSFLTNNYIHTIAGKTPSESNIDMTIVNHHTESLQLPENYTFCKNEYGIPFLQHNLSQQICNASLSHHGRFTALVFNNSFL